MKSRVRKLTRIALWITPFLMSVISGNPLFIGVYFFILIYEGYKMITAPKKSKLPRPIIKIYHEVNEEEW
jgi:hypothetical protein